MASVHICIIVLDELISVIEEIKDIFDCYEIPDQMRVRLEQLIEKTDGSFVWIETGGTRGGIQAQPGYGLVHYLDELKNFVRLA